MTFEAIIAAGGVRVWAVDGYSVPEQVYDTVHPSKLFPADTGMTHAEALAVLDFIKSSTLPPEHRGPYCHTAIAGAKPLRSEALAIHTSQREAVMARNARHGLHVEYDRVGRPKFTDGAQRKKLMRIESEVMGVKIVKQNSYDGD